MSAPLAYPVLFNSHETQPSPDNVVLAVNAFGDRQDVVDARWDVVDALSRDDAQLAATTEGYLAHVAETALLACTAGAAMEQGKGGRVDQSKLTEFAVGPGMAARGISAALLLERTRRLQAVDSTYGKTTRTGDAPSGIGFRAGPVMTLGKRLGLDFITAQRVAQRTRTDVQGKVAQAVIEQARSGEPMDLIAFARKTMGPIIGEQITEERTLLAETTAARLKRNALVRWWGRY